MPKDIIWSWDDQYRTVLTVIPEELVERLKNLLAEIFEYQWDYLNIENASHAVYQFFTDFFGIIPGQQIYSYETEDLILFAVIWPWGEGGSCSLRIGIYSRNELIYGGWSIRKILMKWFDLQEHDQTVASWVSF